MKFLIAGKLKDAIEKHAGLSTVISYRAISFDSSFNFLIEDSVSTCTNSKHKRIPFFPNQIDEILALLYLTNDLSTAFYPLIDYIQKILNTPN